MRSAPLTILAGFLLVLSVTAADAREKIFYFHNDHLGTPQAMSDASGRKVWEAEYEPFGKAVVNQDPDGDGQIVINNLRFPGQYFDAETGLHYNYYRDYQPETGRYLQPDPIGLMGGLNPYRYVRNNPINAMDPLGLYDIDVHYYLTRQLALGAEIDPRIASMLATADQRVDEAYFMVPENPLNWLFGTIFHFQSREYALVGLTQALDQGDIESFGMFLHILQDSFAHEGYGFPFGHARKGTAPDNYCADSARDTEMRELTVMWLKEFERVVGKGYHPVLTGR
jgi:RHS repeat-associated protein